MHSEAARAPKKLEIVEFLVRLVRGGLFATRRKRLGSEEIAQRSDLIVGRLDLDLAAMTAHFVGPNEASNRLFNTATSGVLKQPHGELRQRRFRFHKIVERHVAVGGLSVRKHHPMLVQCQPFCVLAVAQGRRNMDRNVAIGIYHNNLAEVLGIAQHLIAAGRSLAAATAVLRMLQQRRQFGALVFDQVPSNAVLLDGTVFDLTSE